MEFKATKEDDDVFQKAIKEKIKQQKQQHRKICLLGINKLYLQTQRHKKEYNVEYVKKIRNQRDKSYFDMYKAIARIINADEDKHDTASKDSNVLTKNTTKENHKHNFYLTSLINTKYFNLDKIEHTFFSKSLRSITLSNTNTDPNVYELTFTFGPNNAFTNPSITKTYVIDPQTDKVVQTKVTPIKWKLSESDLYKSFKQPSTVSNKQRLIHYLASPRGSPSQNELDLELETTNFNFFKA